MKKVAKQVVVTVVCLSGFGGSVWAASSMEFKELSVSAGQIEAASYAGDSARAEALLRNLFSGAAAKAVAVPVYVSATAAAPARETAKAPAPEVRSFSESTALGGVLKSAGGDRAVIEEEEDSGEADSAPPPSAASVTYQNASARAGAFRQHAEARLGAEAFGGGIGIMLILLLICLL